MKKITTLLFSLFFIVSTLQAQKAETPYNWSWKNDGLLTGVALAGSATGLYLIINKDGISEDKLADIVGDESNINFMDKWVAGNYSRTASHISDVPFYLSFAAPVMVFFDDEINDNSKQVLGMFLQSMATTASVYGMSAGLINRSRPYVYSEDAPMKKRLSGNGQRSFFSGHTSTTATATYFVAKVYQDFNPDSPAIPYVWAGAITLPLTVGFLRMQAGQHFLTDVLLGYGVGALSGYFIPHLHKKENNNISLHPISNVDLYGNNYQAISLKFTF